MKTTTKDITLSPGLDYGTVSPECQSVLMDAWIELQTSAVEAVQTPIPTIFSFAESCFFFAVILQNEPLISEVGGKINSKVNELIEAIDDEEVVRGAMKRNSE